MKSDVLIIGYGTVGKNLKEELDRLNPDVCDKYKGIKSTNDNYKFGFICVDTPLLDDGSLEISEVRNAINENNCDIYIIKSTVPVGTILKLKKETGKKIIFSPEYYGGTQHCNNFEFDFTILGGDRKTCLEVQQLLQKVYDGRHIFRIVESRVAEMCKFMENSFLATKVSFCCEFYNFCRKEGIDYEDLRECFILDKRLGSSHTFVYDEHPYWKSHCLDKDVPSIANQYDSEFLRKIIEFNDNQKNQTLTK